MAACRITAVPAGRRDVAWRDPHHLAASGTAFGRRRRLGAVWRAHQERRPDRRLCQWSLAADVAGAGTVVEQLVHTAVGDGGAARRRTTDPHPAQARLPG